MSVLDHLALVMSVFKDSVSKDELNRIRKVWLKITLDVKL